MVIIAKSKTKIGFMIQLIFQITQHARDEQLMRSLVQSFDCGHVTKDREAFNFKVTKFDDITKKIIPFFQNYKIEGVKAKDFKD